MELETVVLAGFTVLAAGQDLRKKQVDVNLYSRGSVDFPDVGGSKYDVGKGCAGSCRSFAGAGASGIGKSQQRKHRSRRRVLFPDQRSFAGVLEKSGSIVLWNPVLRPFLPGVFCLGEF